MRRERIVAFNHVPKCGGTSLVQSCLGLFDLNFRIDYIHELQSIKSLNHFFNESQYSCFLSGHCLYPQSGLSEAIRYITLIRDPFERCKSDLNYMNTFFGEERSLKDYLINYEHNFFVSWFGGGSLERARRSLFHEHSTFGLVEYYEESIAHIGNRIGVPLMPEHCNMSKTEKGEIEPQLYEYFVEKNKDDYDLYNEARELFLAENSRLSCTKNVADNKKVVKKRTPEFSNSEHLFQSGRGLNLHLLHGYRIPKFAVRKNLLPVGEFGDIISRLPLYQIASTYRDYKEYDKLSSLVAALKRIGAFYLDSQSHPLRMNGDPTSYEICQGLNLPQSTKEYGFEHLLSSRFINDLLMQLKRINTAEYLKWLSVYGANLAPLHGLLHRLFRAVDEGHVNLIEATVSDIESEVSEKYYVESIIPHVTFLSQKGFLNESLNLLELQIEKSFFAYPNVIMKVAILSKLGRVEEAYTELSRVKLISIRQKDPHNSIISLKVILSETQRNLVIVAAPVVMCVFFMEKYLESCEVRPQFLVNKFGLEAAKDFFTNSIVYNLPNKNYVHDGDKLKLDDQLFSKKYDNVFILGNMECPSEILKLARDCCSTSIYYCNYEDLFWDKSCSCKAIV